MWSQVRDLEAEKSDLERTINDMKLKFELAEKQAEEQKEVEAKKHSEEIQFLKRTNQQLKVVCLNNAHTTCSRYQMFFNDYSEV